MRESDQRQRSQSSYWTDIDLQLCEIASSVNHTTVAQLRHRMALVEFWEPAPGDPVLEVGCGQGDSAGVGFMLAARMREWNEAAVIGHVAIPPVRPRPLPASGCCPGRPSGFCAAGTKARSDGSPLISLHRAETMTGCLRGVPACVCSNTRTTLHPLKTLNRMRDRWRRATDSITICGRSVFRRLCQSGPPSFSRAFCTAGSRPVHVGSVADGRADVGMEHRRGLPLVVARP